MKFLSLAAALVVAATTAFAGGNHDMAMGTITNLDRKSNVVTIDHGPMESVNMPAMEMGYGVANPSMLKGLRKGNKIHFMVEHVSGKYIVTEIMKQ
ncbi:copper-binding protein [uncultured Pseudophaeobacter sp.]|jgi:Cu/Ag efflux protein CusF|uniref:copper-binding protein n=1 Tax=uncultured Pseudophaeobacter sp. TaxID=1759421 RepID=UPI0025E242B1|nr:copper-binding protein [uncultured Pseudophaeobacter sp.]